MTVPANKTLRNLSFRVGPTKVSVQRSNNKRILKCNKTLGMHTLYKEDELMMNEMEDLFDFDEELTVPVLENLPLEPFEEFDDDFLAGLFENRPAWPKAA